MKFCIMLSLVVANSHALNPPQTPKFNAPSLGKTHFIVGMPPEQELPENKTTYNPCVAGGTIADLLRCADGSFKNAFFSPDDNLQDLLIQLINQEQHSIQLAVFSFTDGDIAQALIDAHKRGVKVEVITDISSARDKFSKIDLLKKSGLAVHVYNPRAVTILNDIMHNKFVIFGKNIDGKSLVWTGSFNFTKSAKLNNQENIVILDEMRFIERFNRQFVVIKERVQTKKKPVLVARR